ncbi:MAG: Lrp/AsnC family transcriptional regulator [Deltaproteobacteria bacterium]|nr:Lrp/AsnC family transcriptional regulator [Deltaproteobacteria bacterium]
MINLDETDKAILALAQGDLPLDSRPFDIWARELGMEVTELLDRLKRLKEMGIIRDFKAIILHQKAGIDANAMVAWAIPDEKVDELGELLARHENVTHCYERPDFGKYNVFSMIHNTDKDEVMKIIKELASKIGIDDYQVFWSERELKKTSMKYF